MAKSKCPSCGGNEFEVADCTPVNAKTAVTFVQCAGCGAVVGVFHEVDVRAEAERLKRDLSASFESGPPHLLR